MTFEVGTRMTFKYDHCRYGTVVEPRYEGVTTVRWDRVPFMPEVSYRHGEVRAVRPGEEEKFPEKK
jgi:hypothetical protein